MGKLGRGFGGRLSTSLQVGYLLVKWRYWRVRQANTNMPSSGIRTCLPTRRRSNNYIRSSTGSRIVRGKFGEWVATDFPPILMHTCYPIFYFVVTAAEKKKKRISSVIVIRKNVIFLFRAGKNWKVYSSEQISEIYVTISRVAFVRAIKTFILIINHTIRNNNHIFRSHSSTEK